MTHLLQKDRFLNESDFKKIGHPAVHLRENGKLHNHCSSEQPEGSCQQAEQVQIPGLEPNSAKRLPSCSPPPTARQARKLICSTMLLCGKTLVLKLSSSEVHGENEIGLKWHWFSGSN